MAKDINEKPFDEATILKLNIFGECFKEWLPVFIHDRYTDQVHIFDFFAGSGKDANNIFGSPIILLEEAKGDSKMYCTQARKKIIFNFNDNINKKSIALEKNVNDFISSCQRENNCDKCAYEYKIINKDFRVLFEDPETQIVLKNKSYGKFILLDQYGFKEIDNDIFQQLVQFPKTDFIFRI